MVYFGDFECRFYDKNLKSLFEKIALFFILVFTYINIFRIHLDIQNTYVWGGFGYGSLDI